MKALICTKPGQLEYIEMPEPERKENHAIVRIRNIGVCGTDLHAFEGTQPFFSYPRILGHELSGELIEFDNAPGFQKGEHVSFLPYLHCGQCIACRHGKTNCCTRLQVCGVHIDGGMADFYSIPSGLLVHAQGLDLTRLAMVEPLAISAHAVRRAAIQHGEFILVMGAGPIGLGIMEFARLAGAQVIALDINPGRLTFCKTKLEIQHVIQGGGEDIVEQLMELTGGDMPTVVMDATGNRKVINQGLNYLAHGGRFIIVGLQKEELFFSHPQLHKREAAILSSRNATREDFDRVIHCVTNGNIDPLKFITNRVKFEEVAGRFPDWLNPASHVIKVVVEKD